jgi:hypothetical protein
VLAAVEALSDNQHVEVLQLVVAADGSITHLEFVCHIGNGKRNGKGEPFFAPTGVALLPGEGGGQETVLMAGREKITVSQFKLDGTFIRMLAVTVTSGSDDDGEFQYPRSITVLGSSGEVAGR